MSVAGPFFVSLLPRYDRTHIDQAHLDREHLYGGSFGSVPLSKIEIALPASRVELRATALIDAVINLKCIPVYTV